MVLLHWCHGLSMKRLQSSSDRKQKLGWSSCHIQNMSKLESSGNNLGKQAYLVMKWDKPIGHKSSGSCPIRNKPVFTWHIIDDLHPTNNHFSCSKSSVQQHIVAWTNCSENSFFKKNAPTRKGCEVEKFFRWGIDSDSFFFSPWSFQWSTSSPCCWKCCPEHWWTATRNPHRHFSAKSGRCYQGQGPNQNTGWFFLRCANPETWG